MRKNQTHSGKDTIVDTLTSIDVHVSKIVIVENIEKLFVEAELARVKEDDRTINKCTIIDVDRKSYHNTIVDDKLKFSLGGGSLIFLNLEYQKREYSSTIKMWINSINTSGSKYVFVHNIKRIGNLELVKGFINSYFNECNTEKIVLVIIDVDYIDKVKEMGFSFISHDCSDINEKMRLSFNHTVGQSVESAQRYLYHWLKFKKVLNNLSFMEYVSKKNADVDSVACDMFFKTNNFPYELSEKKEPIINDPQIFSEVISVIDLIRKYDPFNLELISELYRLLGDNLNNMADELLMCSDIINGIESKGFDYNKKYETHEMQCELDIRELRNKYASATYSGEYDMMLYYLYEKFLSEYKSNYYVAIRLGFIIFPQLYNRDNVEKSKDVYVKLKIIIDSIEGETSKNFLDSLRFTLMYLSTSVLSLNETMHLGKKYLEKDVINFSIKACDNIETELGYSNVLGNVLVSYGSDYDDICSTIYNAFLEKYMDVEYTNIDKRILNNMSMYELVLNIERNFVDKMIDYVDYRISECNLDSELIKLKDLPILIHNLLFIDFDKYSDIYEQIVEMKNEDFYNYYKMDAFAYNNKEINSIYKPDMVDKQEIAKEIEIRNKKRKDGIYDHRSFLFIDYQFWGIFQ